MASEKIVTAFIDENFYIYLVTPSRIFKYTDVPIPVELFNRGFVSGLYVPLSSYLIGENELIQDWVYNRSITQILNNHEILAKSVNLKYVITLDNNNNLLSFNTRELSGQDVVNSLSATSNNFIHSNEIVSSAVINRALDRIYNIQESILNQIKPEIIIQDSSAARNILGLVTAASGNIIYKYVQPPPIFLSSPQNASLIVGDTATFSVQVSSASAEANISYQWYFGSTAIEGASAATYTINNIQLSNIGYYTCVAADNTATIQSNNAYLAVSLETLFSFASAEYVGNLYSNLYNGASRYGNTYKAGVHLINATSAVVVEFDISETISGPDFGSETVFYTILQDDIPITSGKTAVATVVKVPLSATLTTTSNAIQSDGYPNTYAAKLEIDLTLGTSTNTNKHVPKVKIYTAPAKQIGAISDGYLYNASFTNPISAGDLIDSSFDSNSLTVYGLSGKYVNFGSINNNTLGGYYGSNPYIDQHWLVDTIVDTVNPVINYTPISTNSFTLSATRRTNLGETSLTHNLYRNAVSAPDIPYYVLTVTTTQVYYGLDGAKSPGNGYAIGNGAFKAGTIAPFYGVATYGWFGRTGTQSINQADAFKYTGVGTLNEPIGSIVYSLQKGTVGVGDGGRADGQIYIDGNKSIDIGFKH